MKTLLYLLIGIIFGITMYKSEAASWFRIYEMFRFESFHMYGIIGTALAVGVVSTFLIKHYNIKSFYGSPIKFIPKEKGFKRYLFGGIIFGLGWALVGACPGPIFTLLGAGFPIVGVVLVGALMGTFLYGSLRNKLPH
ncbi:MAG: YeeE/YedE thiosulfate transporter family protein [Flavobacteriaceae bacterium]|jgi:uncharacterized protein|nr:YeeE/YedE thiosulfate transporter family protein [Flavobacteriaceae bacterium]